MNKIKIENKTIGLNYPTYFVADVAANHDGDIERAKDLIYLCAEAGADAAKFQHFSAKTIVSDYGFKNLGSQQSHQASWKKSVYEIYKNASFIVSLRKKIQAKDVSVNVTKIEAIDLNQSITDF